MPFHATKNLCLVICEYWPCLLCIYFMLPQAILKGHTSFYQQFHFKVLFKIPNMQSAKILLLPPKYEIIMVPSNHSYFQYWIMNIMLKHQLKNVFVLFNASAYAVRLRLTTQQIYRYQYWKGDRLIDYIIIHCTWFDLIIIYIILYDLSIHELSCWLHCKLQINRNVENKIPIKHFAWHWLTRTSKRSLNPNKTFIKNTYFLL